MIKVDITGLIKEKFYCDELANVIASTALFDKSCITLFIFSVCGIGDISQFSELKMIDLLMHIVSMA